MPASDQQNVSELLFELKERARELNCLYKVQGFLHNPNLSIEEIFKNIIEVIPQGWQYPEICKAEIIWAGKVFQSQGFLRTAWRQEADFVVRDEVQGKISVYYLEERPTSDEGPFLKEERKLIETIAQQISFLLLHHHLKELFKEEPEKEQTEDWKLVLELLKQTDIELLRRISRKMVNFLAWHGASEVELLLNKFYPVESRIEGDDNRPLSVPGSYDLFSISGEIFSIAERYFSNEVILENIRKWIKEEQSSFLLSVLVNTASSINEISTALERFHLMTNQNIELTKPRARWLRTSLIRTLLSSQPQFIDLAQRYLRIEDFCELMKHVIYPINSRGKLGGKSSGLLLAKRILDKLAPNDELVQAIRTPKTWYLTSDSILNFMVYNNMVDVTEQKYKDISQIRQEYPYITHTFKSSPLPPEIQKGLALALSDFGDVPLIVRSSSLLEDQTYASFAGKYKSFFIANTGTKEERLAALSDAIVEVFASLFNPDAIEYRIEHGLVDYEEEMGVMIQEVVGKRVGPYFLPAFAGVAFSSNEFRWSSRIRREDGLVRIVPGLGTRAVDRLSDDYPILASPGQPGLRVNLSPEEIIYYSPRKIDVINLEKGGFETIDIQELLRKYGREYPLIHQIVSTVDADFIRVPSMLMLDFEKGFYPVTFEGLFTRTPFLKQVHTILTVLQKAYNHPIDIEFAHDGTHFYLLQCRTQSASADSAPTPIPNNIPQEKIIFSANRYISNGRVPDIRYIVYVDPQKYSELTNLTKMMAVGRAVSFLNKVLPKRQFILMGPGRWGSRGDIKLGVSVTYSDINNTAMLIEIARKKKDYVPDLSFGTHFFQDLVEANIRYLPLYPDQDKVIFNEKFFLESNNILESIAPDFAELSEVVRVIDVSAYAEGQILKVLLDADAEKALAFLTEPSSSSDQDALQRINKALTSDVHTTDIHSTWRMRAAKNIAARLNADRFGVKGFYVFGSTKNGTAGPKSDIDILIHFEGSDLQRRELLAWLDGWSQSLSDTNFAITGIQTDGILDIHLVTDEDIRKKNSYAIKIGAVSDAAIKLPMGTALKSQ